MFSRSCFLMSDSTMYHGLIVPAIGRVVALPPVARHRGRPPVPCSPTVPCSLRCGPARPNGRSCMPIRFGADVEVDRSRRTRPRGRSGGSSGRCVRSRPTRCRAGSRLRSGGPSRSSHAPSAPGPVRCGPPPMPRGRAVQGPRKIWILATTVMVWRRWSTVQVTAVPTSHPHGDRRQHRQEHQRQHEEPGRSVRVMACSTRQSDGS